MSQSSVRRGNATLGDDTDGDGLEPTEIHEILSNERRVTVLELLGRERELEVSELAEEIAIRESDERPPPRKKRQSAYVALDQTHLPKLDEHDVVDYDARRKIATRHPENYPALQAYLDEQPTDQAETTAEATPTSWLDGVIAVGVASLVATAVARVELLTFGPAAERIFAEVALLLLVVLLVYQKGRTNTRWFGPVRDRLR